MICTVCNQTPCDSFCPVGRGRRIDMLQASYHANGLYFTFMPDTEPPLTEGEEMAIWADAYVRTLPRGRDG